MNFLAHLHLADISGTSLAANLAGDFAKGPIERFPKSLQQGLWLHRQIDKITDEHEIFKETLGKFPKHLSRAAPILIDLGFDHRLARDWEEYHHQPLPQFCSYAYGQLMDCKELPEKLAAIAPRMQSEDWLGAYRHRQGINAAIGGVRRRLRNPEIFNGAEETIEKLDLELEIAFRTLYPQLMAYARRLARTTPEQYL